MLKKIWAWLKPMSAEELDERFLLPALEKAADARGLTGPERKAAIARAWELHQQASQR